jgi:hypothetical protein
VLPELRKVDTIIDDTCVDQTKDDKFLTSGGGGEYIGNDAWALSKGDISPRKSYLRLF